MQTGERTNGQRHASAGVVHAAVPPGIVIVGGGFGGLSVCHELRRVDCRVMLLDRRNHHLFQPLLYQVAMSGLSGSDIAQPLRRLVERQANAEIRLGEVTRIDLVERRVELSESAVPVEFDALVIACGSQTNWFGRDDWAEHATGLKSLGDAYAIRERLLRAWERADGLAATGGDEREIRRLLTSVVVGGGPTGVEMAGALVELANRCIGGEYRRLKSEWCRVILADGGARLLESFHSSSSARALADLKKMGVEVRLGERVEEVGQGWVRIAGSQIEAETVVWAAGVRPAAFLNEMGVETDRSGRLKVDAHCRIAGHAGVWAIGDAAAVVDGDGMPVPGVAQGALQAGAYVGRAVARWVKAKERAGVVVGLSGSVVEPAGGKPFVYRDKGSMATIGRRRAVAELNGGAWRFGGELAWLIWLVVHLAFLVGTLSKVTVLIKWVWAYLTYDPAGWILTEDRPITSRAAADASE